MASAAPTDLNVRPTRLAGSRGATVAPVLGVALLLVAVVAAGMLGDRPAGPQREMDAASGGGIDAAAITEAIRAAYVEAAARQPAASRLPMRAMRLEQPRVLFGPPPPGLGDAAVPLPRSSRLRVLSWQVDPYET